MMRIDERLSHAKNDLLALCEKLLGELEPSTPRAPNAENVPPSGAPRAVPQRSPSKSPLRPANGGTPAPAPSEDESDGDEGPAPAPITEPTKRKRGRPKDEDASAAVVVRSRGREPSLLLIWVDLVRAAAAEFVLAQPARMESDELRRRGRREFEGVAGFTIGPESAELHQRLSRELRRVRNSVESRHARASIVGRGAPTQALREKIKTARRALADVASSNQLVLPLLARESASSTTSNASAACGEPRRRRSGSSARARSRSSFTGESRSPSSAPWKLGSSSTSRTSRFGRQPCA